jgi:SAM-dependent methyltransferase
VNTNIPSKWWKPDYGFFGEHYIHGDNSITGYRPHIKQSLNDRTLEEANGIIHICNIHHDVKSIHICDIPCGYGRHSLELGKQGYRVTGLDINKTHLAYAEKRKTSDCVTFTQHNILDPLPISNIDVCVNMFYSFGFFESDEENEQALKNIYTALKPGGVFLMHTDVNIPFIEQGLYQLHERRDLTDGNVLTIEESYDHTTKRVQGSWSIGEVVKSYSVRVYSEEEFRILCLKIGFAKTFSYSGWKKEPYSPDSDLMIITAIK